MNLLNRYDSPEKIFRLGEEELFEQKGIGRETVKNILDKEVRDDIKKHMKYMEMHNITIVNIFDKEYPQILKKIYDPPISLYVKGDIKTLNNQCISIIGCRNYSDYGKKAAKYFAFNLAKKDFTIVSGLAKGIDSFAHIASIVAKGRTIAVLGNGLDCIYPKENNWIADEILKNGGALISEYPLGTKPDKMNFPARNRIVSGLSKAILVVEAKEKSGTLITVDFALEQGREVFVVPGNINSINSVGTNELIKQGARVICSVEDVDF